MQVRNLKAKDVRLIVGVLGKELPRLIDELKPAEGEAKEEHAQRIGREMVALLLERHIDSLWEWIADLGGMTPEELGEADAHIPVKIVEEVIAGQSAMDFFGHVQGSVRRIIESIKQRKSGIE
jgi:hypothetical protein